MKGAIEMDSLILSNFVPEGIKIVERPKVDIVVRKTDEYKKVIDSIKVISRTMCVEIDVRDKSVKEVGAIKAGIKYAGRKQGYKSSDIKIARKGNVLYVFSDK